MQILTANDIDIDGFRGVRERQYLMEPSFFSTVPEHALPGIGNLVYLADAHFVAQGTTGLHHHDRIDILTLLARGRLEHQGSLGDRNALAAGEIMLQQAGLQGFAHNEINPDQAPNRIIQIWFRPDQVVSEARYHRFDAPETGVPLRVYPPAGQSADCHCHHLQADAGYQQHVPGLALVFVVSGEVTIMEGEQQVSLTAGSLVRGDGLTLELLAPSRLLTFTVASH